jgi:hypothetical protein
MATVLSRILRREIEMTKRPTIASIITLDAVEKSNQGASPQSKPRLSWAIDPATGKLAARWVVQQARSARIIPFSSAA